MRLVKSIQKVKQDNLNGKAVKEITKVKPEELARMSEDSVNRTSH